MAGLFISYRREDSAGHAGRLFDRLTQHFGKERVFMDVSDIEPGVDFVEAIDVAVGSCAVLVVVIGRNWLTCTDSAGRRRLDDANDFIRLETATALRRNVRVIPVLVQGAAMPKSADLPEDITTLSRRQAIELSDTRWDTDVGQLAKTLETILREVVPRAIDSRDRERPRGESSRRDPKAIVGSAVGILLIGLALAAWFLWPRGVEVPRVAGTPLDVAKALLEERGVTVGTVSEEQVESAAPGTILRQKPAGGLRVEKGEKVDLVVAAADPRISVPDVVKESLANALTILKKAGLGVGKRDFKSTDEATPGTVLSQNPRPGDRLEEGKGVDLVVAGKAKIAVPNIVQGLMPWAGSELQKAGLAIGNVREKNIADARPGTILSQNPPAGRQVDKGTRIDLVVAAAVTAKARLTVPSVVRLDFAQARMTLEAAELVVGDVKEREAEKARPGTVLSQSPAAGQEVDKGTKVDLVVVAQASQKPEIGQVGQGDYDEVQQIYLVHRSRVDCLEVKRLVERLAGFYSNNNLVPENKRYTVMFPTTKKLPTIADLARDRVTRIQAAKKGCFRS